MAYLIRGSTPVDDFIPPLGRAQFTVNEKVVVGVSPQWPYCRVQSIQGPDRSRLDGVRAASKARYAPHGPSRRLANGTTLASC